MAGHRSGANPIWPGNQEPTEVNAHATYGTQLIDYFQSTRCQPPQKAVIGALLPVDITIHTPRYTQDWLSGRRTNFVGHRRHGLPQKIPVSATVTVTGDRCAWKIGCVVPGLRAQGPGAQSGGKGLGRKGPPRISRGMFREVQAGPGLQKDLQRKLSCPRKWTDLTKLTFAMPSIHLLVGL